jgi:hypothetical protein
MIFQALADDKFMQAGPNTNAKESFGQTLQLFSEQDRPSIKDAFYHCYIVALKCNVVYANSIEGSRVHYGLPRHRKKPYINDGIPPVHRRNAKKETRLNFTKYTEVGKQEQGTVLNSSASEVTKISRHQAQLAKYEEESIPWSFEAITQDSGGKIISVTNTCAHDTVLMGLFWLREHDKLWDQ